MNLINRGYNEMRVHTKHVLNKREEWQIYRGKSLKSGDPNQQMLANKKLDEIEAELQHVLNTTDDWRELIASIIKWMDLKNSAAFNFRMTLINLKGRVRTKG